MLQRQLCIREVPRTDCRLNLYRREWGTLCSPADGALWGCCCNRLCPDMDLTKGLLPSGSGTHGITVVLSSKTWGGILPEVAGFVCLIFVWGPAQLNNCSCHALLRCVHLGQVPGRLQAGLLPGAWAGCSLLTSSPPTPFAASDFAQKWVQPH